MNDSELMIGLATENQKLRDLIKCAARVMHRIIEAPELSVTKMRAEQDALKLVEQLEASTKS